MSAEAAIQKAIVAVLRADARVAALVSGRVLDRVQLNTELPYVHIRSLQAIDDGSDCVDGWEIFVDIDAWDGGVGKVGAARLVDAVRRALHEADLTLDVPYRCIEILHRDSSIDTEPDGLTTRGRMTFHALVERTDFFETISSVGASAGASGAAGVLSGLFIAAGLAAGLSGTTALTPVARLDDPAYNTSGVSATFTNSNRTMTHAGADGSYDTARGTYGISAADTVIFDVQVGSSSSETAMGIGNASQSATAYAGDTGNNSIALWGTGEVYLNGAVLASGSVTFGANNTVGVKVNGATRQIWFRRVGFASGAWQGPYSFAAVTGTVFPCVTVGSAAGSHGIATLDFTTIGSGSIDTGFYKIAGFDNIVVAGDSYAYATYLPTNARYSEQLLARLGTSPRNVKMTNTGYQFGQTSAEEVSRYVADIRSKLSSAARANILITVPTTSDLKTSGITIPQMITNHQTWVNSAVSDGWTVLVGTLPTWDYAGNPTYTLDSKAAAIQHDAGVRALTGIYAVFDLAADPNIGTDSDYTNLTYWHGFVGGDTIPHPSLNGYTKFVDLLEPLVDSARGFA